MDRIYNDATQLIGHTPLLRVNRFMESENIKDAEILAKLEYLNPAGSTKDRAALNMIEDAKEKGILKPGATIIEPTSGNTGIGLALVAAIKGYKVILTLPDTMSKERRTLLMAYGAELRLTPGAEGMSGAIKEAERLNKEIPGSMILGQFDNIANAEAHFKTTGPEIYNDCDGRVDIFVAGIGTGGTITGIGRYLKKMNKNIKIVGFEPDTSPLLTKGFAGAHGLQGIGANFVPSILDKDILDEVMTVSVEDAYRCGNLLAKKEGILCGITSGAALYAASVLAKRPENKGKRIVVLLPDSGDRYLSTPLFE